jgi:phosphinothricin acetyltransferase
MQVIIRPAHDQVADLLCGLIWAAFEEYRTLLVPPSGAHAETPASIAAKLAKGGGFIAYRDHTPVGGVLYELRPDHAYLGRLAVLPAYRGAGIGARLVEQVEAAARAAHLPALQLGVRAQLPGNLAFFEARGCRVIRPESHAGFDYPTFYILRKTLT